MSTETLENKHESQTFETTTAAADFAECIADTIREGLKDAPKFFKREDMVYDEDDLPSNVLADGAVETAAFENTSQVEEMPKTTKKVIRINQEYSNVMDIDDERTKKNKKSVDAGRVGGPAYGLDNIELRNEVVQEKRRAIRVESKEDRDILSDAIQKRLEQSVFGEAKVQEGFHIVNIMQECLKSEDILAYMKNAGCCTCERCQADVLAATLSHLPAMYVVMYKKSTSARISFYHENYKMDILTSIMRAIRDVKDHPHHGNDRIQ